MTKANLILVDGKGHDSNLEKNLFHFRIFKKLFTSK